LEAGKRETGTNASVRLPLSLKGHSEGGERKAEAEGGGGAEAVVANRGRGEGYLQKPQTR